MTLAVVPTVIGLMPGVASADPGESIKVTTANESECPTGGLKLDGINDRLIPNGTYSINGLTILITNSVNIDGTLSFDWVATAVPDGSVVTGVVLKGGQVEATEAGGLLGSVSWTTPPWYSHVSFCIDDVVEPDVCPDGTTVITDDTDADGNGVADMCEEPEPDVCPDGTTVITDDTDADGNGVADMCERPSPVDDDDDDDNDRTRTQTNDDDEPEVTEVGEVLAAVEVAPEPAVVETVAAPAVATVVPAVVEAPAPAAPAELPRTGVQTSMLLQMAIALIGTGALLTRLGRRTAVR